MNELQKVTLYYIDAVVEVERKGHYSYKYKFHAKYKGDKFKIEKDFDSKDVKLKGKVIFKSENMKDFRVKMRDWFLELNTIRAVCNDTGYHS